MTKAEFNDAFRKVVSEEFAAVPTAEAEITHTFSLRFRKRMGKLIKAEKNFGWRWVNTAPKRAVIAAAVLLCVFSIAFGVGSRPKVTAPPQGQPTASPLYELKEENGKYYMHFSEEILEQIKPVYFNPNINAQISAGYTPRFPSVADMKNAIVSGDLSEVDLVALAKKARNGMLEIPNPDRFCDAVLPDGLETGVVYWSQFQYHMAVNWHGDAQGGAVFYIDLEGSSYESHFNRTYTAYTGEVDAVISDSIIEDRNAREVIYTGSKGTYKKLLYEIDKEGKTLYVVEFYHMAHSNPELLPWHISETVPQSVEIFGQEEDGTSWYVTFNGFEERPAVDWLKAFGVRKPTD